MKDSIGREINYLRVSITDRCNLRCKYCMPDGINLIPMEDILSFEEIERVCKAAAQLGIDTVRITGGEPLVRRGCSSLVRMIKAIAGIQRVNLTTNGVALSENLKDLVEAGLNGVNISLDTLDRHNYENITGKDELQKVLEAMDEAIDAGLNTKINVVLSEFEQNLTGLAEIAKKKPIDVRFIELMPIGEGKEFSGISAEEAKKSLGITSPGIRDGAGPAEYYKLPCYTGRIGFITAMSSCFCDGCNRLRLTSTGMLRPCLASDSGVDVKSILRSDKGEEELREAIKEAIIAKPARHRFNEGSSKYSKTDNMNQIGG